MREGVLHIRDVEGPKKTRSLEARLEAMEQQVFKCQGMVERGLNANHMIITEFTKKHKIDANDIGKHLSRLYDRIDHLQAQIYDLQNQNCDWVELKGDGEAPHRPDGCSGHGGDLVLVLQWVCFERVTLVARDMNRREARTSGCGRGTT
ncbi:40S ribosomal protein S5-1 [Hordeum vulgare]|nr:40S ribosomal protein S5-1 [Hordeum vulgare]